MGQINTNAPRYIKAGDRGILINIKADVPGTRIGKEYPFEVFEVNDVTVKLSYVDDYDQPVVGLVGISTDYSPDIYWTVNLPTSTYVQRVNAFHTANLQSLIDGFAKDWESVMRDFTAALNRIE